MDAILPHGKLVVLTIRQLLGNLSRHKTLTFVVAGAVGLAFILLLLEISVRNELAKEASDAAIDAVPAPSASPQKMEFGDAFSIQRTGSISFAICGRVRCTTGYTVFGRYPNVRTSLSGADTSPATS
jgi:hypothetical protein